MFLLVQMQFGAICCAGYIYPPSKLLRNCLTPFPNLAPPSLQSFTNDTQGLSVGLRTSGEEPLEPEISNCLLCSKEGDDCDQKPWVQGPAAAFPIEWS